MRPDRISEKGAYLSSVEKVGGGTPFGAEVEKEVVEEEDAFVDGAGGEGEAKPLTGEEARKGGEVVNGKSVESVEGMLEKVKSSGPDIQFKTVISLSQVGKGSCNKKSSEISQRIGIHSYA